MNRAGLPEGSTGAPGAAPPRVTRQGLWRLRLETEVCIAATAEQVWTVMTDFVRYAEWNPAIPSAQGEARVGTVLKVVIEWPGLKRDRYALSVTEVERARVLAWLGHFGVRGLMDGDHRFVIEPLPAGGVRVRQVEDFAGLLIPIMAPWLRDNVLRGFVAVNEALKCRVESLVCA